MHEEIQEWYDGYVFGKTEVYNPWSVTCYLDSAINDKITYPRPYWASTSSNSIVKELIESAGDTVKAELEDLMFQKTIVKPVYEDIYNTPDNLWNFLLLTGYLKAIDVYFNGARAFVTMAIHNREVRYIYESSIMEWLKQRTVSADFSAMYLAALDGRAADFETYVKGFLKRCISFYDEKETFYHGFIMGIMGNLKDYRMLSNRETGNGRADIILNPIDERKPAVIFELKYTKDSTKMEIECDKALRQIEERSYAHELLEDGCTRIIKYGICFCKKKCRIKCGIEKDSNQL